jgi:hypothetical protein
MPVANNILNSKIEDIETESAVNIGNFVYINPRSSTKAIGGSSSVGDISLNFTVDVNVDIDPDVSDFSRR